MPFPGVLASTPPGETITHLLMAVAADRGEMPTPRVMAGGTRVSLKSAFLRGSGDLVVTVHEGQTLVRLEGTPPPWPLSMGWELRTLRRLLGERIVRPAPSSAG